MTGISIADLENAKLDVDHIAEIATSTLATSTDRLGTTKATMAGLLGGLAAINNRGAWVTATLYLIKDLVSNAGTWYVCIVSHTSSAAFATDTASKWRVYQGVIEQDLASSTGATLVGYQPLGIGVPSIQLQAELRNLDSGLTDLSQDPAFLLQPLNYLQDSIGLGYSNGALHINGNLQLGAIRNLISYSTNITNMSVINATKDTTRSVTFKNILMQRIYGSNFYSASNANLVGTGVILTAGKKYLISCYVLSVGDTEKFVWMRNLSAGGDNGHNARLVDGTVRRIWALAQATTTGKLDLMPNPAVALGAGPNNDPYWFALNRSSVSIDLRIGGFMIEQVPDATKMGVAVIGDSTVQGAAGSVDLASSTEWTRWAEGQLNVPFFNRGVGGNTTANMRSRWVTDMTPLAVNASHAIIQGGINDIVQGRLLADIQTDILWMRDQSVTDGMTPVICTCTPTSSIQANTAYEAMRQALNLWIKQTFDLVLDLDKVVRDPTNPALLRQKSGWVGDGIHFDTQAKRAIGIYIAKWPFWGFITPSPYQEQTGNASTQDPVRAGSLFHTGSGYSTIDVSGTGAMNLKNDTRLTAQVLEFSGVLTSARTVYFQGFTPKLWFVRNTTTGAFTLDVRGVDATGTAFGPAQFTIVQGKGAWVLSTGAGIVRASADI
jgi:hypothetical protein